MKHLFETLFFIFIIFMLGLEGCGKTTTKVSFCIIGNEQACADLRGEYQQHRKPPVQ